MATVRLAEHLVCAYLQLREDHEWTISRELVLSYFAISDDDLDDLAADYLNAWKDEL